MSWNYRVVRDTHAIGGVEEEEFSVREVYYDGDRITSWTTHLANVAPGGDDFESCRAAYDLMGEAFTKPVVDVSTGKAVELEAT